MSPRDHAVITCISGPDIGAKASLRRKSFFLIGREADLNTTMSFRADGRGFELELSDDQLMVLMRKAEGIGTPAPLAPAALDSFGKLDRGTDMLLRDPTASRVHAAIVFADAGLGVVDMGSKNGIEVNGAPVTSAPLGERDIVRIGSSRFSVSFA